MTPMLWIAIVLFVITDEVIQSLIEVSAAKHRVASAKQLREALATIG